MTSAALHTPLPVPPHPSLASRTCVLGETGKGHLIVGESPQLEEEYTHKFTESSQWCKSLLVTWFVILAGRGGAGWGRSALKETEEVNLWCPCKAALQGKPITYPSSWRLQGRAPWVKQRRDEGDGNERTWAVHFQCKWVLIWLCPQGLGGRKQHYKVQGIQCTLHVSFLFSEGSFVFMARQVYVPISVLDAQTHRHLPKLLGVGKNAVPHEAEKYFAQTGVFWFLLIQYLSLKKELPPLEVSVSSSTAFCPVSSSSINVPAPYSRPQTKLRTWELLGVFKLKILKTSIIRSTKRKFTKFKVTRKSGWALHITNVTWVMVWWSFCD